MKTVPPLLHIRERVFGVNQLAFAAIAGTSQSSISKWESGWSEPDRRHMLRIRREALKRKLPWLDAWFFEVPR